MPSSGSSDFDFDLFHFLGFTNELRIFSAFLHSSNVDRIIFLVFSLNRHGHMNHMTWGHILHSEEGIALLNCFCMVYLLEPEVLTLEAGIPEVLGKI
jgi:hypothetical protein